MKTPLLAALGALAATIPLAGCAAPEYEHNHWHINHVSGRIGYHFFGHQSEQGTYLGRIAADERAVALTFRRHFLNDDPNNPLMPQPTPPPYRPEPPDVEFTVNGK